MRAITILGGGPGKAELSHHRGGCVHISRYHFKLNFKFHHTVNTVVELCNVTNATIPGGTLSLMKTLKVPCSGNCTIFTTRTCPQSTLIHQRPILAHSSMRYVLLCFTLRPPYFPIKEGHNFMPWWIYIWSIDISYFGSPHFSCAHRLRSFFEQEVLPKPVSARTWPLLAHRRDSARGQFILMLSLRLANDSTQIRYIYIQTKHDFMPWCIGLMM
jgi:hypothetical protein